MESQSHYKWLKSKSHVMKEWNTFPYFERGRKIHQKRDAEICKLTDKHNVLSIQIDGFANPSSYTPIRINDYQLNRQQWGTAPAEVQFSVWVDLACLGISLESIWAKTETRVRAALFHLTCRALRTGRTRRPAGGGSGVPPPGRAGRTRSHPPDWPSSLRCWAATG